MTILGYKKVGSIIIKTALFNALKNKGYLKMMSRENRPIYAKQSVKSNKQVYITFVYRNCLLAYVIL
jgi:hypothetical protein